MKTKFQYISEITGVIKQGASEKHITSLFSRSYLNFWDKVLLISKDIASEKSISTAAFKSSR